MCIHNLPSLICVVANRLNVDTARIEVSQRRPVNSSEHVQAVLFDKH